MVVSPRVRVRRRGLSTQGVSMSSAPWSAVPPAESVRAWPVMGILRTTVLVMLLAGCSGATPATTQIEVAKKPGRAEDLLIVDCLLPGQIRQLGTQMTMLTARRAAKLPAS